MNFFQKLRRIGQISGWNKSIQDQDFQMPIIKKMYSKAGLEIKITSSACPEEYEVFKNGHQVAYYRLRHGKFRVDYPECGGDTLYEASPNGDGIFETNERLIYMSRALKILLNKLK